MRVTKLSELGTNLVWSLINVSYSGKLGRNNFSQCWRQVCATAFDSAHLRSCTWQLKCFKIYLLPVGLIPNDTSLYHVFWKYSFSNDFYSTSISELLEIWVFKKDVITDVLILIVNIILKSHHSSWNPILVHNVLRVVHGFTNRNHLRPVRGFTNCNQLLLFKGNQLKSFLCTLQSFLEFHFGRSSALRWNVKLQIVVIMNALITI